MQIAGITFLLLTLIYAGRMLLWLMTWRKNNVALPEDGLAKPLSIVICFRNEKHNLPKLLSRLIPQLRDVPGSEIILVDDHSTDAPAIWLDEFVQRSPSLRFFSPLDLHGKKACQQFGIAHATNDWIATLDADVCLDRYWLNTASLHAARSKSSLLIMPLMIDDDRSPFTGLQSLESLSLLFVTASSAMAKNAILCNGANLLFTKELFSQFKGVRYDDSITSGDDIFLLEFARKHSRVEWLHDRRLLAKVSAESNMLSFAAQRVRWASKTTRIKDFGVLAIGMLVFFINVFWLSGALICIIAQRCHCIWFVAVVVKIFVDFFALQTAAKWLCKTRLMRFFPALVILYPVYAILIPLLGFFWNPQWKGRRIRT